jgi:hypothetical protein
MYCLDWLDLKGRYWKSIDKEYKGSIIEHSKGVKKIYIWIM